jgi:hypothetical protein
MRTHRTKTGCEILSHPDLKAIAEKVGVWTNRRPFYLLEPMAMKSTVPRTGYEILSRPDLKTIAEKVGVSTNRRPFYLF